MYLLLCIGTYCLRADNLRRDLAGKRITPSGRGIVSSVALFSLLYVIEVEKSKISSYNTIVVRSF